MGLGKQNFCLKLLSAPTKTLSLLFETNHNLWRLSCGNSVAQYRIKWFASLYDWLDSLKWRPCLYR